MNHKRHGRSLRSDEIDAEVETSGLDPDRKERMRQRLMNTATLEMDVVRTPEQDWEELMPGVNLKMLHADADNGIQIALWRMDPGARLPAHPHHKDEECYLIEGSLEVGNKRYQAGDFMLAPAGSRHGSITSPEGVTMLIRGELLSVQARLLLRAALSLGR